VEIAAYFAQEQSVKFTHGLELSSRPAETGRDLRYCCGSHKLLKRAASSVCEIPRSAHDDSLVVLAWSPSDEVGMSKFDEHVLERRSPLSQFAHGPVAIGGEAKNLFAHIDTGFHPQGKSLPVILPIDNHIPHT
jgi:hypothetical protein